MFVQYGLPEHLQRDNSQARCSRISRRQTTQHTFSALYYPVTNGQDECFVQTFKRAMKAANGDSGAVKSIFCRLSARIRNASHTTTGMSPDMVLLFMVNRSSTGTPIPKAKLGS